MYGPSLCVKFQQRKGADVKMSLFTSGCPFEDVPSGLYKMWEIPLVLKTTPMPGSTLINDDDERITYSGNWCPAAGRGFFDHNNDVHYTASAGDSLQLEFNGTGIEVIAEKDKDLGDVDVYLDGALKQSISLRIENFPRLSRVTVFSIDGLSKSRHTIKLVNKSAAGAVLDAFRVYGDGAAASGKSVLWIRDSRFEIQII